jgi:hypothetical protein
MTEEKLAKWISEQIQHRFDYGWETTKVDAKRNNVVLVHMEEDGKFEIIVQRKS